MKALRKRQVDRAESILRTAYHLQQPAVDIGLVQTETMRRIRHVKSVRESIFWGCGNLAWRLMPATALLLLVAGASLVLANGINTPDMISSIYHGPLEQSMNHTLYSL